MTNTLVDTNVLIDLTGEDPVWEDWSTDALKAAADRGEILINQVIYAELCGGFAGREDLDVTLQDAGISREDLPWSAAFAAGIAFKTYRDRGGSRRTPLPDFFIGAHAAVRGYRLLTRDRGYFAAYFPSVTVVSPDTHP